MNDFHYQDGQLFAEGLPVAELAARHGTPLYVYSRTHLQEQYRAVFNALRQQMPNQARDLTKLERQVDFFFSKLSNSQ